MYGAAARGRQCRDATITDVSGREGDGAVGSASAPVAAGARHGEAVPRPLHGHVVEAHGKRAGVPRQVAEEGNEEQRHPQHLDGFLE